MGMNARRKHVILVAVMVFAALVPVVSGEAAQSWHLLDTGYTGTKAIDDTTHHYNLFMNKTDNANSYMSLPNVTKETTWWYAEHPAQFDGVAFEEDNWTVSINHGPTDGCTIWANVCRVNDSTGEVTYMANGSNTTTARVSTIICYDVSETNQIFNTGERLTFRIYHNRSKNLLIYYYNATDEKYSSLTSPASDPGYPVPEPSTLILTSAGLILLVCIAGKRSYAKR